MRSLFDTESYPFGGSFAGEHVVCLGFWANTSVGLGRVGWPGHRTGGDIRYYKIVSRMRKPRSSLHGISCNMSEYDSA